MENALIEAAMSQGIWGVLFVALFLYTIKNKEKTVKRQEEREEKYQCMITNLTDKFSVITKIEEDTEIIIEKLKDMKSGKM